MQDRAVILSDFGASGAVLDELLRYTENPFKLKDKPLPLDEPPHLEAWRGYSTENCWESLRSRWPQLRFPIQEGISQSPGYLDCTRRGRPPEEVPEATGLELAHPGDFRFQLQPTPAGTLPVLLPRGRADFVTLLRALSARNEPIPVPDSMGACLVRGFNNWDRIHRYLDSCPPAPQEYLISTMLPHKELYQDTFLLISDGPYSQVPAGRLGLGDEEWRALSQSIRLHHECTHYCTLRLFGSCRNNLQDEVLADYAGLYQARGRFEAGWLRLFMGLEDYPRYREGGRFQNYLDDLSAEAAAILRTLVVRAADRLERWQLEVDTTHLIRLCQLSLPELACDEADAWLERV